MSHRASLFIGVLALLKGVVALTALALALPVDALANGSPPLTVRGAILVLYTLVGGALVVGGSADQRCREWGAFLMLVASPFADPLARVGHPLYGAAALAATTRLDAFLPACLWLFLHDFPTAPERPALKRFLERCAATAMGIGSVLFIVPAVVAVGDALGWQALSSIAVLSRSARGGVYWPLLFLLMLPAAPILWMRRREAHPAERNRVTVFITAVALGLTPIALDVLSGQSSARLVRLASDPTFWDVFVVSVVLGGLLSVPFTTAYSILVDEVLDLRLLARTALRYALAKHYTMVLVGAPAMTLAWLAYRSRASTLRDLLVSPSGLVIIGMAALAFGAHRARRRVLKTLDKRFFREEYDAQEILGELLLASRAAESTEELITLLRREIERSLHPDRMAILVRDDATESFHSPDASAPPLTMQSTILRLLGSSDLPLDLEPGNASSVFRRLDEGDQTWLADSGFRMLVPLRGSNSQLLGVLALGERRSGLPYSTQDKQLLAAVGASGGLFFEGRARRSSQASGTVSTTIERVLGRARECRSCAAVLSELATECDCGSESLAEAPLPMTLAGKFRIERRIGAGGMGVVYRALDLGLNRPVAVKALPRTSAERTWRLRREAKAMAMVTHPNLAVIYGLESWRGQPFLIVEYLAGGTLSDRLRNGPLPPSEAYAICLALSDALDALHSRGLVHRDLKPSNIGFTAEGAIKLLDLGLVRLRDAVSDGEDVVATLEPHALRGDPSTGHTRSGRFGGTPPYMSPEAVRGETPSPSFDLWSLAVVLIECLTGTNPFRGATLFETIRNIEGAPGRTRALDGISPDASALLAAALARDRRQRPASARQFARTLSRLLEAERSGSIAATHAVAATTARGQEETTDHGQEDRS